MASNKGNSRVQIIIALFSFLGILVGTFGTILLKPDSEKPAPPEPTTAKVQQYEGVYIFVRSRPIVNYLSLGIYESNSLTRSIENASNKKGFGNIIKSIGQTIVNDISFENRLAEIVHGAKNIQPDLQGLIFYKDLTQCEIIKFK